MKIQFLPLVLIFIINWSISNAQIFVDSSAIGANNGMTWVDAFNDLQDALSNAEENDTIWIAKGTYFPDSVNGASTSTFMINTNLVLLGGFNSVNGEQNPNMYKTILSGDLNENDIVNEFENNKADNVSTIVTINSNITNATIFEGLIFSNGHANGNQ